MISFTYSCSRIVHAGRLEGWQSFWKINFGKVNIIEFEVQMLHARSMGNGHGHSIGMSHMERDQFRFQKELP